MTLDEIPWKPANIPEENKRRADLGTITVIEDRQGLYFIFVGDTLKYLELDALTAQAVLFELLPTT